MLKNKKIFLGCILLIFALFLFLRLWNLLVLPIQNDEAIQLNWTKDIADNWQENKFTSLSGIVVKPPLHYWILAIGYHWFSDPVYSGRFISVLLSIFGFLGIFLLVQELFRSRLTTVIALILYTFCPFTLFYDRMVLADGLISILGIYIFYFAWLLFKTTRMSSNKSGENLLIKKIVLVVILGMVIVLARLTKQTILIFILAAVPSLIWFILKNKIKRRPAFFLILEFILAYCLAELIYRSIIPRALLDRSSAYGVSYILNFSEFVKLPFDSWIRNFRLVGEAFINYLTWPLIVIFTAGCFGKKFWTQSAIQWLLVLPFFSLALFILAGAAFWPRNFLFVAPIFIILIAFSLKNFFLDLARFRYFKKVLLIFACLLIFLFILLPSLCQDWRLLTSPIKFKWEKSDEAAFINSWGSGYAMTDVANYLKVNTQDGQLLFLDMSLGYPFAYIYLYQNQFPQLKLSQLSFGLPEHLETARRAETIKPILVLLNPDRRPEDQEFEKSDICRNKKVFYQPNKINHFTLCFIE